jgi:hypothetical protein|tara:strand:+ start:340 stop:1170 length:831 start_codon:yes stop_codon:yes gene_type:complete
MIIENTQQLDELMGLMRRAAGAAGNVVGSVQAAKARVRKSATGFKKSIGQAYRSGVEGGRTAKRGSASFAINRAKRRVKVAGGDLSKTLRGKKTGYDVNMANRRTNTMADNRSRASDRTSVAKPQHRARLSATADRILAKRKAAGKTTTHAQAYQLYKKVGNTEKMSQVKKAFVNSRTKQNLARDTGSGSGNRARKRSHAVARATMPKKVGVTVRQKPRRSAPLQTPRLASRRRFGGLLRASWNPTFDKLMNEVFAKPILTQEERQLVIINGTDKK